MHHRLAESTYPCDIRYTHVNCISLHAYRHIYIYCLYSPYDSMGIQRSSLAMLILIRDVMESESESDGHPTIFSTSEIRRIFSFKCVRFGFCKVRKITLFSSIITHKERCEHSDIGLDYECYECIQQPAMTVPYHAGIRYLISGRMTHGALSLRATRAPIAVKTLQDPSRDNSLLSLRSRNTATYEQV
jgi:hypothetical protein